MKYLSEYRDPETARRYLDEIERTVTRPWTIMEVCGGQTHGLVRNGILNMLPPEVNMVHGPGCPVCVTSLGIIDKAIYLAEEKGVILCSFGDMMRVPGTERNLQEAKAAGADVRVMYSPLEAVRLAERNPDKEVVFFAVGFETTAPANALSVLHAERMGVTNFSILSNHVLVPPAIRAVMDDPASRIQGFLAAGHVCTIMGTSEYGPLVELYGVPVVVTGFEPLDLLQGILMVVRQLEAGEAKLENQYTRMVRPEGNATAMDAIYSVFEVTDLTWRGLGEISQSGYRIREEYAAYDAIERFGVSLEDVPENPDCISGAIMKGLAKPNDCPNFGTRCKPEHPLGAPMVSSEGACAAYYNFRAVLEEQAV